jgi:hypothetical protein
MGPWIALVVEPGETWHHAADEQVRMRGAMYEPLLQRTREEVVVILQQGDERGAVRRAVRAQVMSALGTVEVTTITVQQIAYDVMRGAFQAAEQTGKPIDIVGEEASDGVLEAVREKGARRRNICARRFKAQQRRWKNTPLG